MRLFLSISNDTFFVYYLLSNLIYLILLITAIFKNTIHRHRLASLKLELLKASPFTPPITLLVPAHNEESSIVESVRALLSLDYPALEVIVVNDGSSDSTLEKLELAFQLQTARVLYIPDIATAPLRGIYRSPTEPQLLVLDKEAAGCKADAINAGLNAATSPYICVVDADSILEKESLMRIMAGVFSDPSRVVAVGGIVRILNNCTVTNGELKEVRLPKKPIEVLQVIEYLRAFLVGREAWAGFNMLPIISGAFGTVSYTHLDVYKRQTWELVRKHIPPTSRADWDLTRRQARPCLGRFASARNSWMEKSQVSRRSSSVPDICEFRVRWPRLWCVRAMSSTPPLPRMTCSATFRMPYLSTSDSRRTAEFTSSRLRSRTKSLPVMRGACRRPWK